jgi:maltooligosyltrehalose trehalohydrolase
MGQEWAASTPFQFFTDHNDEIGPSVTEGRKEEFGDFPGFQGEVPDPQDPATFQRSVLDWNERSDGVHERVLALYRDLLSLRRSVHEPGPTAETDSFQCSAPTDTAIVLRQGAWTIVVAFEAGAVPLSADLPPSEWVLHTEDASYTSEPHPPTSTATGVRFERAGALVCRTEA